MISQKKSPDGKQGQTWGKGELPGEMGGSQLCSGGGAGRGLPPLTWKENARKTSMCFLLSPVWHLTAQVPTVSRAAGSSGSACSAPQGPSEVRGVLGSSSVLFL